MTATLEFRGIKKSYGKQSVLEDINLTVHSGEFLTFLGPSGSGKSTLLRLVGGFERPDDGQILLEGDDISRLPPFRRRVNTVFQNYALFPHLTVHQNIAFGLQNQHYSKAEIECKVKSILEVVRLTGLESRFPEQLSGGQQQRVALARALVMQPVVLLLDEPLGALDQKLRRQMQTELKALQRKVGLTFVFVTHDQEEALGLSDRVAVLNQGRLEQVGRPDEIYDYPQTRFVADFMGIHNIFSLVSVEANREYLICRTEGGQVIRADNSGQKRDEIRFYAIRPSRIFLSRDHPPNDFANVIKGTIREGTYLGSTQFWSVQVGGNETWTVSQMLHQDPLTTRFSPQEEVYLCWDSGSGRLLRQ